MTRGLVFCALACGAATPAIAGERNAAIVAAKIPVSRSVLLAPDPVLAPGRTAPSVVQADFVVNLHTKPELASELAAFEALPPQPIRIAPRSAAASPFALSEVQTVAAWRVTDRLGPVTAGDNGTYAVRDALADYRKPRAFRSSPLNATLMLRIDGNDDSPPLSVGGGGVAAVLWKAMPQ